MSPTPYLNSEKDCYGYNSVTVRWPLILQSVIESFRENRASASDVAAVAEADEIITDINRLIEDINNNAELRQIAKPGTRNPNVMLSNQHLFYNGPLHWQTAPWLFSECYVYTMVLSFFDVTKSWHDFDPYQSVKEGTFPRSSDAVGLVAERYAQACDWLTQGGGSQDEMRVWFDEFMKATMWSNAADMSLLATVSFEDIQKRQTVASHQIDERLLVNDEPKIWSRIVASPGGRVDIVLDNAGFEFFTDVVFALFLLESKLADEVVLHPKSVPWFISDVTPHDWQRLVPLLKNEQLFPHNRDAINKVIERIGHFDGKIKLHLSHFWSTCFTYGEINRQGKYGGEDVWTDLKKSKMVFFKGDLNFRKLTSDLRWPRTTSFAKALGTLDINHIDCAALRTVKSDCVVGLAEGKDKELEKKWALEHPDEIPESWSWSGHYAVVCYAGPSEGSSKPSSASRTFS